MMQMEETDSNTSQDKQPKCSELDQRQSTTNQADLSLTNRNIAFSFTVVSQSKNNPSPVIYNGRFSVFLAVSQLLSILAILENFHFAGLSSSKAEPTKLDSLTFGAQAQLMRSEITNARPHFRTEPHVEGKCAQDPFCCKGGSRGSQLSQWRCLQDCILALKSFQSGWQ